MVELPPLGVQDGERRSVRALRIYATLRIDGEDVRKIANSAARSATLRAMPKSEATLTAIAHSVREVPSQRTAFHDRDDGPLIQDRDATFSGPAAGDHGNHRLSSLPPQDIRRVTGRWNVFTLATLESEVGHVLRRRSPVDHADGVHRERRRLTHVEFQTATDGDGARGTDDIRTTSGEQRDGCGGERRETRSEHHLVSLLDLRRVGRRRRCDARTGSW